MSNRDSRHRRRRTQFSGAFAGRLIEMLECPAYRILSVSAHRVLAASKSSLRIMAAKKTEGCP
jgi:hypothetical protein